LLVDDVLAEMEKTAREKFLPSIGPTKGKIIGDIIKKYKSKSALEIGTFHGYSSILMAKVIIDYVTNDNTAKIAVVVTLEINPNLTNIAMKNIEKAELSAKIKVITGDALEVIPKLVDFKFDLIFLDAAKSEYLKYLTLAEENNLLNKKGTIVVIADNVLIYENEMKDYLDYVRNSGRYNSHTIETTLEFRKKIKDALEVSISVN
jgi:predicted O-methyltransferase YrrM